MVLATNDRILGAAGATWYDCVGFDCSALDAQMRATAQTVITRSVMAQFSGGALLLVKDPRLCLVLDLWLPALQRMKVSVAALLVLRHPSEVMASLARRDRLPAAFTTALWLQYMLAAEYASRVGPRQIISYDLLLRDWRHTFMRAGIAAAIAWPLAFDTVAARMDDFLRTDLRHHRAYTSARQSVGAPLGIWADEVHDGLLALAADGGNAWHLQRLDLVRAAFADWCRERGRAWSDRLLAGHAIREQPPFEVRLAGDDFASHQALTQRGRHREI
jgi:hypothetical protein